MTVVLEVISQGPQGPRGEKGDPAQSTLQAEAAAAQASLSAVQASSSQIAAAASAASASNSKASAEVARDAALAAAKIYASTAAGLAAVTSGAYFYVPSTDDNVSLILYLNNAGAAVEQKRFPSSSALSLLGSNVPDGTQFALSDALGKVAFAVRDDGTVAMAAADVGSITGLSELNGVTSMSVGDGVFGTPPAQLEYLWSLADGGGHIALGVRRDGSVDVSKLNGMKQTNRNGACLTYQINYINGTGQSLAAGAPVGLTTVQEYDNLKFAKQQVSPGGWTPATFGNGEDPTYGTMGHIKELLLEENGLTWQDSDYQLLAANNGVAAQDIDALSKGGSTGAYEACMSQVTSGLQIAAGLGKSFAFQAVTWTQGEANAGMAEATYKAKLIALAKSFNTDGKAITGQPQDIAFICYQTCSNADKSVAVAQWKAAAESPLISMSCPLYQFDYLDFQHINNVSTKRLGGYYGLVYKRVIIDRQPWEPLQPSSVQIAGNNIDVYFNKSALTFDTTLMPAQTNYGFSVDNGGTPVTINSATLMPGNRVRLALDTTPAIGWKVRYGHNAVTGKSPYVGGGGNLRDSQGDAIKYYDHPMHNWCVIFDWEL